MSELELFSTPLCPFAHRVRQILAENKIDYRLTEIDLSNNPQAIPEGLGLWQGAGTPT
jgi:glutathione S-transferase